MNEIITKQHNDLIDLPLRKFNASEMDILLGLCSKVQNEHLNEITLSFKQIKELAHYKNKNDDDLFKSIERTKDKLKSLNFQIGSSDEYVDFVLFRTFIISKQKKMLTVKINEDFEYMLNNLTENYTSLELKLSASLRTTYAKAMYKQLRRFRSTGLWQVSAEKFREYMDVPASYKMSQIKERIIDKAIEELSPTFKGLHVEYIKEGRKGKGRRKVTGFKFLFTPEKRKPAGESPVSIDYIARAGGWNKTGKYCPVCLQEIYEKKLKSTYGEYILLGHPDFKTGICDKTFNDYSQLLSRKQLEEIRLREKEPEIIKENVDKIEDIVNSLFAGK